MEDATSIGMKVSELRVRTSHVDKPGRIPDALIPWAFCGHPGDRRTSQSLITQSRPRMGPVPRPVLSP